MAPSAAGPPRGATRDDVARLAGVSSAVVSYVVNNGPRPVSETTRRRVEEAIDKLGYRPNAAARSLIKGRSDLLGLIVPDIRNPYFAALAQAVERAARKRSLNLVLTQGPTGGLASLVESLGGHLVAGIIAATLPEPEAIAAALRNRIPMVKLSLASPGDAVAGVWPDYYGGARTAVRHLVEVHGHQRIALVMGADEPGESVPDDRQRGWQDALESAGLGTDHLLHVPWSAAGGRAAAGRIVREHPGVSAVFTSSDQQAIGFIAGLNQLGLTVPGDLALVSFDGSPDAEYTVPPLTTAAVPMAAMADDALAILLGDLLSQRGHRTSLVIRESCGCSGREQGRASTQ